MIKQVLYWYFMCFHSQYSYLENFKCSSRATLRCLAGRMWPAGRTLPIACFKQCQREPLIWIPNGGRCAQVWLYLTLLYSFYHSKIVYKIRLYSLRILVLQNVISWQLFLHSQIPRNESLERLVAKFLTNTSKTPCFKNF